VRCAGCQKELEVGDQYIAAKASEFIGTEPSGEVDLLIAELFGGSDGRIVYCEDCTQPDGDWLLETVYGDEADA